MAVKNFITS